MSKLTKIIIGIAVIVSVVAGYKFYVRKNITPKQEIIKIGVILPLSGDVAYLGESAKNAAILAAEQFNNSNRKNKYELVFEDDQASSAKTIVAFKKLFDFDKIKAVVTAFSGPGNTIAPLAEENKIIAFAVASDMNIAKNKPFVFNHWIKPETEVGVYLQEAEKRGLRKIAVLATNQEGAIAVAEELKKTEPGRFIFQDGYLNPLDKDFKTPIMKAYANKPDAFLLLFSSNIGIAVKQIKNLKIDIPLTSIESFGRDKDVFPLLEGDWFTDAGEPSSDFIEQFKIKYNNLPQTGSGYIYDIIKLTMTAFEKDGNPENAAQILSGMKKFPGAMGSLTVDPDGNIESRAVVKVIKDGKPVVVSE